MFTLQATSSPKYRVSLESDMRQNPYSWLRFITIVACIGLIHVSFAVFESDAVLRRWPSLLWRLSDTQGADSLFGIDRAYILKMTIQLPLATRFVIWRSTQHGIWFQSLWLYSSALSTVLISEMLLQRHFHSRVSSLGFVVSTVADSFLVTSNLRNFVPSLI